MSSFVLVYKKKKKILFHRMDIGLAILSAIVVFFFVEPLTTDGMIHEDQDVSLSLSLSLSMTRETDYNIFPVSSLLGRTWL